jgi:hypothetical protein
MAANIITQEDLDQFKIEFFEEQKLLLQQFKEELNGKTNQFKVDVNGIRWIKSHQVQRMLSISPGTLQTLRSLSRGNQSQGHLHVNQVPPGLTLIVEYFISSTFDTILL